MSGVVFLWSARDCFFSNGNQNLFLWSKYGGIRPIGNQLYDLSRSIRLTSLHGRPGGRIEDFGPILRAMRQEFLFGQNVIRILSRIDRTLDSEGKRKLEGN